MQLEALVKLKQAKAAAQRMEALGTNSHPADNPEYAGCMSELIAARRELNNALDLNGSGLFEFVDLVGKVRKAQKAYFEARQKGSPKSHIEKLLTDSKRLEAQLDKELAAFHNPPMF